MPPAGGEPVEVGLVRAGRITEIDVVAEPGRLRHVDPGLFVD